MPWPYFSRGCAAGPGTRAAWVGRLRSPADPGRRLRAGCFALAAVVLVYAVVLARGVDQLIALGDGWREAAAVLLLMPIGFCAGVPFPAAIAWAQAAGLENRIPWMYALNGVAAVVGLDAVPRAGDQPRIPGGHGGPDRYATSPRDCSLEPLARPGGMD